MSSVILSKLGMFLAEDFLDAEFCARLRTEVSDNTSFQAKLTRDGESLVDENRRRTRRAIISEETSAGVKARLLELKPRLEAHFGVTLAGCQEPQFLIYREGDFFHAHRDVGSNPQSLEVAGKRQISTVIFLNDETKEPAPDAFCGGSFVLFEMMKDPKHHGVGLPVAGKTGTLIAFSADKMHEVTPVTDGERFTVVTWFV